MKSNNKRQLISCIAFVCKNTESAKRTIKHLENEYGFDLIWREEEWWRLKSANNELVEIWTQELFNVMRAYRYHIVFVEECIYEKMYEKACCSTSYIDDISYITPAPFRLYNFRSDTVLDFDKERNT